MLYNEIRVYVINYFCGFKNYSTSEEEDPNIELKDLVFLWTLSLSLLFFVNTISISKREKDLYGELL